MFYSTSLEFNLAKKNTVGLIHILLCGRRIRYHIICILVMNVDIVL